MLEAFCPDHDHDHDLGRNPLEEACHQMLEVVVEVVVPRNLQEEQALAVVQEEGELAGMQEGEAYLVEEDEGAGVWKEEVVGPTHLAQPVRPIHHLLLGQ